MSELSILRPKAKDITVYGHLTTCTRCEQLVDVVLVPDGPPPNPSTYVCVQCLDPIDPDTGERVHPVVVDPLVAVLRETSVEASNGPAHEADVSLSADDEEPPIAWGDDDGAAGDIARNRAAVLDGTYDPATAPLPEGF